MTTTIQSEHWAHLLGVIPCIAILPRYDDSLSALNFVGSRSPDRTGSADSMGLENAEDTDDPVGGRSDFPYVRPSEVQFINRIEAAQLEGRIPYFSHGSKCVAEQFGFGEQWVLLCQVVVESARIKDYRCSKQRNRRTVTLEQHCSSSQLRRLFGTLECGCQSVPSRKNMYSCFICSRLEPKMKREGIQKSSRCVSDTYSRKPMTFSQ